jgi:hypothetical protein
LKLQSLRVRNLSPGIETLKEIVNAGFIPASHAFDGAILRR